MKIKIGIVGYGNLGRAVERTILSNNNYELITIFSRRLINSKFNTRIEPMENMKSFIGKIDVMLLCGGSKSDLEVQTPEALENFDCINTFDTHKKIVREYQKLDKLGKKTKHRLIMCAGWDPGIFSLVRATAYAINRTVPITFWGKGISMGHSDAIRRVPNVIDGVQFTLPNTEAVKLAKCNKLTPNTPLHIRDCYVVCKKEHQQNVAKKISNIPNYFKGQPTNIHFVSGLELLKLKSKMYHKGEIISSFKTIHGSKCGFEFKLKMDSNPNFTATVVAAYIKAIINLKQNKQCGAFTPLDIPTSYLYNSDEKLSVIENFC